MKKTLLTALFVSICGMANAQALKVLYEVKNNNKTQLEQLEQIPDESLREHLKQQLLAPNYYELQTNGIESLYKHSENYASSFDDIEEKQTGNVKVMVVKNESSGAYQNYKTKEYLEGITFFNKNFFIKDKTIDFSWKISNEEKKTGNFLCKKAVAMHNGKQIVAWFTDDFPVPAGPLDFNGLPGLILELDDDGDLFTAIKIEKLAKSTINKPLEKGKVISRKEFDKIQQEKTY